MVIFPCIHSPFRPNAGRRHSDRPVSSPLPPSSPISPQWKVDLPQNQVARNHGKFVPMQFRTQPANIPGGIHRQATNLQLYDRGEAYNFFFIFLSD